MSNNEDIIDFDAIADAEKKDQIQVFFGAGDEVRTFGTPDLTGTVMPAGAVRSELFDLPVDGVDPNRPLWDYKKPEDGDWTLRSQDSCLERDHGDLETYRAEAIRTLTARVNSRNEKAAGIGLGRDALHNEKMDEVTAFEADGAVGPFIQLEMNVKGKTAQAVVDSINEKRAAELVFKLGTEEVFLTVKEAIKAASTHSEIQAATQNIVWPGDA